MNIIEHAKREFLAAGYDPVEQCEDNPNKLIQENVLELLEVFRKQGHSGFSASFCIKYFSALAQYEPLAPLSGVDSEWSDVGNGMFQNNRCSHVFKRNGIAWDINGYIFKKQSGSCHTGYLSARKVDFPYTPKSVYVNVISYEVNKDTNEPEEGSGWWHTDYPRYILNEREALKREIELAGSTEGGVMDEYNCR